MLGREMVCREVCRPGVGHAGAGRTRISTGAKPACGAARLRGPTPWHVEASTPRRPRQWAFPGDPQLGGLGALLRAEERKGPLVGRAEQGRCMCWETGRGQARVHDQKVDPTGKRLLRLGGSYPFGTRAFSFQLAGHIDCPVSQWAGRCRRRAGGVCMWGCALAHSPPIKTAWAGRWNVT